MRLSDRGLSLVELMVSTAIVGLLSSVALPSYHKYIAEARMSEGVRYVGDIRKQQLTAYTISSALESGSTYADRFISKSGSKQSLLFRVSANSRFDVILGSQNFSGIVPGEAVAQSDLPDSPLNQAIIDSQFVNRTTANFGLRDNGQKYIFGVAGDIDDDPGLTMFVSTDTLPLVLACNDLDGSAQATLEFAALQGGGGGAGPWSDVVPSCEAYQGSGQCGQGCGPP